MSVSSEELNYMVWRYLQEMGQELTALAMQEETRVLEFDQRYREHIPVGQLVDLIQKGILYTESELLVEHVDELKTSTFEERQNYFNDKFNLVNALKIQEKEVPEIASTGRFSLENESEETVTEEQVERSLNETHLQEGKIMKSDSNKVTNTEETSVEIITDTTIKQLTGYNFSSSNKVPKMKPLHEFKETIVTCEWHPTNPHMLCTGHEDSVAQLIMFNDECNSIVSSKELRHPFALSATSGKDSNKVTCLAWSPDGEMVVTGVENGEIRIWNQEGHLTNVFNFHRSAVICMRWSPNSQHFVSMDVDNVAILWDISSGTVLQHYELKSLGSSVSNNPESLGVDIEWVDERRFVLPNYNGTIGVYETTESKPIGKLIGHQGAISCLEFHPVKKLLASAADDFTIRIWHGSNSNSTHCFYGHAQAITSLQWLTEDLLISGSMDGTIRIWSISQNQMVGLLMLDGIPIFVSRLSHSHEQCVVGTMNGSVYVATLKEFIETSSTEPSSFPIPIAITATYEGTSSVNDLSWSEDSLNIVAGYTTGPGSVLSTLCNNNN